MYRCERCGKEFPDDFAKENEGLCSRKCGGALVEVADSGSAAGTGVAGANLVPIAEGQVVDGRWRVGRLIGEGGQGLVFLAEEESTGRKGALKALHWQHIPNQETVRRFEREARLEAQLDHPGIIRIWDIGLTPARQPYFVMEYLAGGTLHRDIKPENIMFPDHPDWPPCFDMAIHSGFRTTRCRGYFSRWGVLHVIEAKRWEELDHLISNREVLASISPKAVPACLEFLEKKSESTLESSRKEKLVQVLQNLKTRTNPASCPSP